MSAPADEGLSRLETELRTTRRWSARGMRDLHRVMVADLRAVEKRARQAERRLAGAEERAKQAEAVARRAQHRARRLEQELDAVRASTSWKVGRVLVGVPAKVRRRLGR